MVEGLGIPGGRCLCDITFEETWSSTSELHIVLQINITSIKKKRKTCELGKQVGGWYTEDGAFGKSLK